MTKLSVNVNKLALLRNSREKNNPDLVAWSKRILGWGAHGITVHPRPDGRHVRSADVPALKAMIDQWNQTKDTPQAEFNVEGFPSPEYMAMVLQTRPDQCTLVPDPPEALTSNAGWKTSRRLEFLEPTVQKLKKAGLRVSLFIDVFDFEGDDLKALIQTGADRIELYTEAYAEAFGEDREADILARYREVAERVQKHGLGVNAGHDLNQRNLGLFARSIPGLDEVSIGHALVCEALENGFEPTIYSYLRILSYGSSDSYAQSLKK